jgi:hypothetical protein
MPEFFAIAIQPSKSRFYGLADRDGLIDMCEELKGRPGLTVVLVPSTRLKGVNFQFPQRAKIQSPLT